MNGKFCAQIHPIYTLAVGSKQFIVIRVPVVRLFISLYVWLSMRFKMFIVQTNRLGHFEWIFLLFRLNCSEWQKWIKKKKIGKIWKSSKRCILLINLVMNIHEHLLTIDLCHHSFADPYQIIRQSRKSKFKFIYSTHQLCIYIYIQLQHEINISFRGKSFIMIFLMKYTANYAFSNYQ